jgi:hypothetical protein
MSDSGRVVLRSGVMSRFGMGSEQVGEAPERIAAALFFKSFFFFERKEFHYETII